MLKHLTLILALFIAGCSSEYQMISKNPPKKYKSLGNVTGTSTGSLGILATGYYFIPMGLNSRVTNAYNDALSKAPGATSLINVNYKESWFWWVIGTGRKVTISGEAIKEIE